MILILMECIIKILIVKFSEIFICYKKILFMVNVFLNVPMDIMLTRIIRDVCHVLRIVYNVKIIKHVITAKKDTFYKMENVRNVQHHVKHVKAGLKDVQVVSIKNSLILKIIHVIDYVETKYKIVIIVIIRLENVYHVFLDIH